MSSAGAPVRPALYLGSRGMAVGWHGPLGPAVAYFGAWSRERPDVTAILGRAGADRPAVPALDRDGDDLVVAWCEEDGAWVAPLRAGGLGPATLAIEGARAVALAGGQLFAADADGLVARALEEGGRPGGEVRRLVAERRADVLLSACALRGEALLTYSYDGDPSWGAVSVRGDTVTAVRHRIDAPVRAISARAAGTRAGVALELRGGDVRFALLGPEGKVVERPHPVFARGIGALADPEVVWVERGFRVLARERATSVLRVVEAEGSGGFTLPRMGGAFATAYYAQHLHALEVTLAGDEATMHLWRCEADGRSPQQRVDALALPDASRRRRALAARRALLELALRLEGSQGYRGAGPRAALEAGETTLRTMDDGGPLSVGLAHGEEGWRLRVGFSLDGDRLPEPPPSLVRLARWIRLRLSGDARDAWEQERARGEELAAALGATLARFDSAGPALVLEVILEALPDPDALHRWLRRLREDHRRQRDAR